MTGFTSAGEAGKPDSYSALHVEQRGIELIPDNQRHTAPWQLSLIWAGGVFNFAYVVYGAFVIYIGLSFWQAIAVILLGNLSYLLVGAYSLQAPGAGTSAFVINRAPFGVNGGRSLSWFNWVTVVGYEITTASIAVLALLAFFDKVGIGSSTGLKVACIIGVALVQAALPFLGHAAINRVLRILLIPFSAAFIVLAVLMAGKVHLSHFTQHAAWQNLTVALALVFSVAGFGWANMGNDYSRYLPRDVSLKRTLAAVTLGGAVPSVALMILGAAIATTVQSATNPVSGLAAVLPSWFVIPYLWTVIPQTVTTNSFNLYSSGLTLQAAGIRIRRYQAVIVDSAFCLTATAAIVFSSSFNTVISDFLLFTLVWLTPWAGVFGADVILRKNSYDGSALLDRRGPFAVNGGVNIAGCAAFFLGMVASAMWINTSVFDGPLSSATGASDFSVFMGLIVGGGSYAILHGVSARRAGRTWGMTSAAAKSPSLEPNAASDPPGQAGPPTGDAHGAVGHESQRSDQL
jgi:NCS1 family nucleobase:cation symporter-1